MSGQQIIKPLHGLRGLAAMTVVVGHIVPYPSAPAFGVVLFFVLSGFLIGKLYLSAPFGPASVWKYSVSRIARVYPLFAFVIVVTGLINLTTPANIFDLQPEDVWRHLLLAGDANTVWTISAEFQFYAAFVLIWGLSSLPRSHHRSTPLLLLIFALAVAAAAWLGDSAGRIDLLGYLPIFLAGMLATRLPQAVETSLGAIAAWVLPIAGLAYALWFLAIPHFYVERWVYLDPLAVGICVLLVVTSVVQPSSWSHRLLSTPALVWLGELSFGIYLWHRHAEWAVDAALPEASILVGVPIKIALALLLAQLSFVILETPSRRWLRTAGERVLQSRKVPVQQD